MDKKLLEHEEYVKTAIKKFEHELKASDHKLKTESIVDNIKELSDFNQKTIHNFQHERSIHLTVTLFFVSLLLASIVAMLSLMAFPSSYGLSSMSTLMMIVIAILFVTDIFYIRHYYQLENGTQRLYELSKKLYNLSHKI